MKLNNKKKNDGLIAGPEEEGAGIRARNGATRQGEDNRATEARAPEEGALRHLGAHRL